MNILDEDIDTPQRQRLASWNIHFRHIGSHIGWSGMKDHNDVIPLLHSLRSPTFFTCDHGFYQMTLRHDGYCLVYLDVPQNEAAAYIRRFLRHSAFRSQSQRMGNVIRVRHGGLSYWQTGQAREYSLNW